MPDYDFGGHYDFSMHPELLAVYLFGSRATGKEDSRSDIDISIVVNGDFNLRENYDLPLSIADKLEAITEKALDVVIFNTMDPLLQTEIRVKGKLIYVRDKEKLKKILMKARKEFEDYLVHHRHYADALERRYIYRMVNQDIVSRLLGLLTQYLRELKEVQSVTWDAFSTAIKLKRFVERTLQMCVEVSLDVGNHIISDAGWREAETNRDIFLRLNERFFRV